MRLFVAIELTEQVKASLCEAQRALARFDRVVRWVKADQMHLTLKFLGEVVDDHAEEVIAATALAAEASVPFEFTVGGRGCFPLRGGVRVVWAGVSEPGGALLACNSECETFYEEIGFSRERRSFSPHLTLGRVREDKTGGQLRAAVEAVELPSREQAATEMCVIQSTLTPQGARYKVISRHPLGGA